MRSLSLGLALVLVLSLVIVNKRPATETLSEKVQVMSNTDFEEVSHKEELVDEKAQSITHHLDKIPKLRSADEVRETLKELEGQYKIVPLLAKAQRDQLSKSEQKLLVQFMDIKREFLIHALELDRYEIDELLL